MPEQPEEAAGAQEGDGAAEKAAADEERRRYFSEILAPVLEDMAADVLREMPREPMALEAFMEAWLGARRDMDDTVAADVLKMMPDSAKMASSRGLPKVAVSAEADGTKAEQVLAIFKQQDGAGTGLMAVDRLTQVLVTLDEQDRQDRDSAAGAGGSPPSPRTWSLTAAQAERLVALSGAQRQPPAEDAGLVDYRAFVDFVMGGALQTAQAPEVSSGGESRGKLNILLQEDLVIRGGAQLWLMNCGVRLKAAGHNVTFLLPEDSLLRPDIEAMEGVVLRTYEHGKSAEDPESYRELFTQLLTPANACVTLVRQRRGSFQNVDFMASCIDRAGLKTFLIAKTGTPDASYEKCFYGGALLDRNPPQSTVITIADYTRQFIIDNMGVDGKYITNIYNGTDIQKFKRTPEMAVECLKRYPLKEGDYVVGCIGSFEQRKGQKDLLNAAKMLIDDGRIPNIHVLMVGEGPDKEMLAKTIEEQGLQNNATLFDFTKEPFYVYERCSIIALPSYKEGLPNVLLEALAMDKPCVASRIMGCPEVVRDGVTGYCFECGNVKEIADAIAKIHGCDAARLAEMAAAGKQLVFEEHDKAKQFEKILDVITSNAC